MNSCAVCNAPSTKRCTACSAVYYCSKEHQKQDWKNHKASNCLPYKIEENAVLGKHMVAARQLAKGQLVLDCKKPARYFEVHEEAINAMVDFGIRSPMKHNCCANCYICRISISGEPIIRTAKDIAPGELLSICYTKPFCGTRERSMIFKIFNNSPCNCIRCLDPTELGTHVSSLKCKETGCNGLLVPPDNDHLSSQPWQCQACHEETSAERVESFISSVSAALSDVDKDNLAECHDFINRFEPYLHENHYLLTEVRLGAVNSLNTNWAEVDWGIILKYCRQLDQLFDKVGDTAIESRGFILTWMGLALRKLYGKHNQEAKQVNAKAYHLLKFDPDLLQRAFPMLARGGRH